MKNAPTPSTNLPRAGSQTAKSTMDWRTIREAGRLSALHRRERCPVERCGIHVATVTEARP
jgi:hypothetical protein